LLEDLLLENSIRYWHIEQSDELFAATIRDKSSYYDGHEIYVLRHTEGHDLKLYVDKEDFSIIHLEFESTTSDDIHKRKNMVSKFVGSKKSIDFRRYRGKMYPSFFTMTSKINWYDSNTGQLKFETELFQQLLINKVNPNPAERIGSPDKMKMYGLQYQDLPYNKPFWDRYNVIKDTPLDKKIIADLEKVAPLEKQFEEN
jgi:hypothetical protein